MINRIGRQDIKNFYSSIWFFPVILTILLFFATGIKISGSSLAVYDNILGTGHDKNLLVNKPQSIRSDEWLVTTQMTIAQKNNHFARVNQNIGNGEDVSLFSSIPSKDWSTFFKPDNWAFFILPLDNAFAFKWWFIGYAMVLACYFLILAFLPGMTGVASLLSLSLFFAPFNQWWYITSSFASLGYSLALGLVFVYITRTKSLKKLILLSLLFAYLAVGFILVLYPPFMIPVTFVMALVGLGIILEQKRNTTYKELAVRLGCVFGALIIAGLISATFVATRTDAIKSITHTAYPGQRIVAGGGVGVNKLFTGFLETQLQNPKRAINYLSNQSESSNFILLGPFLLLPALYLIYKRYKLNSSIDWPLLIVNVGFLILCIRAFSPFLDPFLKLLLFDKVPAQRLLIGFGLINVLQITFLIRALKNEKDKLPSKEILAYCVVTGIASMSLAIWTLRIYPGYIGFAKGALLALIIPICVYLILSKKFISGLTILLILSFYSSYQINPLYKGTAPLSSSAASVAIRDISSHSKSKWVAETIYFENFPQMNGAPSISGVYMYPQKDIWKVIDPNNSSIYNRYAHAIFIIDRTPGHEASVRLQQSAADAFSVSVGPCSKFLHDNDVRYILAVNPISSNCTTLIRKIPYPRQPLFIYHINKT